MMNNNFQNSNKNILIDAESGMLGNSGMLASANNNYSMNDISYFKKQNKYRQDASK